MECASSWPGDHWYNKFKDKLRLVGVRLVNRKRIQYQNWDLYAVPSHFVRDQLIELVPSDKVYSIGHGMSYAPVTNPKNELSGTLKILTVSGFTPHKGQHMIPRIAQVLDAKGVDYQWKVVGPIKHHRYVQALTKEISRHGLSDRIELMFSIDGSTLSRLYKESDLYVHPSFEEGFCLTALEAASFGLFVIGRNTGAIPEIIEHSQGVVVSGDEESFAMAISEAKGLMESQVRHSDLELHKEFNWIRSGKKYIDLFECRV
jgi:glycosyltransferase involved in cell wall biosynthesis